MTDTNDPQLQPPRWERLAGAAALRGLPHRALLADIESGRAPVRLLKIGKRGLPYVCTRDLDAYLAAITTRGVAR